jgi:hypothetical protein
MALSAEKKPLAGTSVRTRFFIGAQVLAAVILATSAVLLVTWLSERRGLRWRVDLTSDAENTLDPASKNVIDNLPEKVDVDVFFSASEPPFQAVGPIVQDRMLKLLRLAADESGGRIAVTQHDLGDRARLPASTQARMVELNQNVIEPGGLFVVSLGKRREVVRLRPNIADLDPGQPDPRAGPYQPARIVSFRGEEALVSALLKVTRGDALAVCFTAGHGERDSRAGDQGGIGLMAKDLEGDGFDVATWDGSRQGALPKDATVLAIIGPEQVFTSAEIAEMRRFVESGGRVIAALGEREIDGEGSLAAFLSTYGVRPRMRGIVAQPSRGIDNTLVTGSPECGVLAIGIDGMPAQNPITESLRRARRRVFLSRAHALDRGEPMRGGYVLDLLRAPDDSWLELPDPTSGRFDWAPGENEPTARFTVAMQASFAPPQPVPEEKRKSDVRPECRLIVLGTADACANYMFPSNRDFVLNAFNWLADRDYHVRISPTNPQTRRIDLKEPGALARVNFIAVVLLPATCLALGLFTAWKRRRR